MMFETLTIGTKDQNYCLKNMKEFSDTVGLNVPKDLKQPVDVFLQIFPKVLIEKIVFQTNLYALQSSGAMKMPLSEQMLMKLRHF